MKEKPINELEKLEGKKSERGTLIKEKPNHGRKKKTRFISKKQKKIEKDIMELKKTDESNTQKMENQNNIELKTDESNTQKIKKKNDVSENFEFIVQQYAGSLSLNFINIFADLFSSTHIRKVYYLLLSGYNFFFSKNKMIASIILFYLSM